MRFKSGQGRTVSCDIETDDLDATRIWVICAKDVHTGESWTFRLPDQLENERRRFYEFARDVGVWVFHNGLDFDVPVIHRLLLGHEGSELVPFRKVLDTLVLSRLVNYSIDGGHSLDAWGKRLNLYKGDFKDFKNGLTVKMVEYCRNDVDITTKLYWQFSNYLNDSQWAKSIECEHDTQIALTEARETGFPFDLAKATNLLSSVKQHMAMLEDEIQEAFPPVLEEVKSYKYREYVKTGEPVKIVQEAMDTYPRWEITDGKLVCYDYKKFNPGSPKDRIERLWESGWKPFDRTKTHQQFLRLKPGDYYSKTCPVLTEELYEEKKKHLEFYGWKTNEDNLQTLPEDAPAGARALSQWITLEARRSSLVEWINQVKEDGRIHGTTIHIGAWTHRGSHKAPNTANISSPFHGEPRTEVEKIKHKYDLSMRASWCVESDNWMVGTDAEGIQLRILGDWLWRHFDTDEYAMTIVNGRKEDETDIHNVNKRALGLPHLTRDDAKTFIYSWVLNAGVPKTASILRTTERMAAEARDRFERSIPGLSQFKRRLIPFIARKGGFTAYDGRFIQVPNEHKTLAGILQGGEAIIMKHAMNRWIRKAREEGINFNLLAWVHDEWQTKCIGTREEAEALGQIQRESIVEVGVELGVKCPLAGSTDIGKNWAETH